jgi:hypothetical protein
VSSIQASSIVVTFQHQIILCPGSVFCFGTISSVADEEETLHRIADPPERKSSSKISEKIGAKQGKVQPPVLQKKITFSKLGAEGLSTRRTPLSTSPTEEWTRITRRKEANEVKGRQAALSVPPPSKENRKKIVAIAAPFYPNVLFIGGRVESNPVSDDEPTVPGEEPLHRESRRRRNRRRNIRRHHEAEERDPAQPVSRDEVTEVGETPEERVLRERRNSRRCDRRQAQEQAEQETRQRRENPLFGRNLNPDFARSMNTPRAIGCCSLKQPTTFYPSLTRRTIYDTPSTVSETHGAPSTLRTNNDTRTRSVAGKSTTGITASRHGVRPLGPSRPWVQLVAPPGDGRGTTTTTPLHGKDIITDDKKTVVEYRRLLHASGPFNGPRTSRSPMSTNMNLSRIWEAGWPSTPPPPEPRGQPRM